MRLHSVAAVFLIAIVTAGGAVSSDSAPDTDAEILTHGCAFCHGPAGISQNPIWPSLAGLDAAYLEGQLEEFAKGASGMRRGPHAPQMYAVSALLSSSEQRRIARYYASLPAPGWRGDEAAVGAVLYREGTESVPACAGCHGADGAGLTALGGPRLAGQPERYLVSQLRAYADGSRDDAQTGMRAAVAAMTDEQMHAVAAYLSNTR